MAKKVGEVSGLNFRDEQNEFADLLDKAPECKFTAPLAEIVVKDFIICGRRGNVRAVGQGQEKATVSGV